MNNLLKLALVVLFIGLTEAVVSAAPRIMVVPDKAWCVEKGYVNESMRDGKKVVLEDYRRAMADKDFRDVSSAIKRALDECGISAVDSPSSQNIVEGDDFLNEYLKQSKLDILITVGWDVGESSAMAPVNYRLEAIDVYTGKTVAVRNGEARKLLSQNIGTVLRRAVAPEMDYILMSIQGFFDDVAVNGREVRMILQIADNGSDVNMNTEYGGEKLRDIIKNWIDENSQNHKFTQTLNEDNKCGFNVRMPLKTSNGSSMDVSYFASGLQQKLKELGVPLEIYIEGSGAVLLKLFE